MERDDRDMQDGNDTPTPVAPSDGPARAEGEDTDAGATSQDQPS